MRVYIRVGALVVPDDLSKGFERVAELLSGTIWRAAEQAVVDEQGSKVDCAAFRVTQDELGELSILLWERHQVALEEKRRYGDIELALEERPMSSSGLRGQMRIAYLVFCIKQPLCRLATDLGRSIAQARKEHRVHLSAKLNCGLVEELHNLL